MALQYEKALAVVPARGGSKRLPRKNLQDLGGKPLVGHTIEAAVQSGCFADIVLSSDDEEIIALASSYPGVIAHKREPRWASDTATVFSFLLNIARQDEFRGRYDVIGLLLPTAPFRQAFHLRAGAALLTRDCDAVISVTAYEFPPQFAVELDSDSGFLRPVFESSPLLSGRTRSQDQRPMYRPNGAFYLSWWESFLEHEGFYGGRTRGFIMSREESIDIDTEADLDYARAMLERRQQDPRASPEAAGSVTP